MITKDNIRFRGKHIDDLTPDELKDALLQALNRVAELENAQQQRVPAPPSSCEDCGSENPDVHYAGCVLAKTAGR